jgi:hypothetical protein
MIDIDKVAESISRSLEKQKFYYSEESQQNKYIFCGNIDDILGKYGYCSKYPKKTEQCNLH